MFTFTQNAISKIYAIGISTHHFLLGGTVLVTVPRLPEWTSLFNHDSSVLYKLMMDQCGLRLERLSQELCSCRHWPWPWVCPSWSGRGPDSRPAMAVSLSLFCPAFYVPSGPVCDQFYNKSATWTLSGPMTHSSFCPRDFLTIARPVSYYLLLSPWWIESWSCPMLSLFHALCCKRKLSWKVTGLIIELALSLSHI